MIDKQMVMIILNQFTMYRQTALNKNHKRLENKLKIVRQRQQTAATAFYLSKYMKFVERNEQSTVF